MESNFNNFNLSPEIMKKINARSSQLLMEIFIKIFEEFNPNAEDQIGVDDIMLYTAYVFQFITMDVYQGLSTEYVKQNNLTKK